MNVPIENLIHLIINWHELYMHKLHVGGCHLSKLAHV